MANYDADITLNMGLSDDEVIQESQRLRERIEKILNSPASSKLTDNLRQGLVRAYDQTKKLEDKMSRLKGSVKFSESYEKAKQDLVELESETQRYEAELKRLRESSANAMNTEPYRRVQQMLSATTREIQNTKASMREMEQTGKQFDTSDSLTRQYVEAQAALNRCNNRMIALANSADDASKKTGSLKDKLVSLGKRGISSILGKLKNAFKGAGKSSGTFDKSLKRGLTTILKYGFGIRSIFFLVRRLRNTMKEGWGEMAQYSEPFNRSISNIVTSFTWLKRALATAFAPLVTVVSPILSRFMDQMVAIMNTIGKFIASLTGQTTFIQAKKVYVDYAKSLDNASASTNKATKATDKNRKATEKAKKTISGFDDVEILHADSEDNLADSLNNATDGLEDIGNAADLFETVPIETKISDFAKRFKAAWAKADLTEIGAEVGTKLRDMLTSIPWEYIQTEAQKTGQRIATFLNGFMEVEGLPESIGATLGEAINTVVALVDGFVDSFHWDSFGEFLATGLQTAVETVDWNRAGQTLVDGLNGVFTTVNSFATTYDWEGTAQQIIGGLNTAIGNFDWGLAGESVANVINGLFVTFDVFIRDTDWKSLGNGIMTTIVAFFSTFNWANVGSSISHIISGLLNFFSGVIQAIDWASLPMDIVNKIGEFLSGFDWKSMADSLGEFIGSLVKAMFDLFKGTWNAIFDIVKVIKDYFAKKIKEAGWEKDNSILDNGKAIAKGILNGVLEIFNTIYTWIKENVFDPFMNGLKRAFGIASPAKETAKQGKQIAAGLLEGIKEKLFDIGGWLKEHVFDKIKGGLDTAFGIAGGVADKVVSVGSGIIGGIKEGVENTWDTVTGFFDSGVDDIQNVFTDTDWWSIGDNIVSGIGNGISAGWDWLTTTAGNLATDLFDTACNALGIQSPSKLFRDGVGKNIVAGIVVGVDNNADSALKSVTALSNSIANVPFDIPDIAKGHVVPYQATIEAQQNNQLQEVIDSLNNPNNNITREDMREVMTDVFRRSMNIDFYIGDEQIARHNNNGQAKLNKRMNFATN